MKASPTLSLRGVGKSYAGRAVVDDVSFDVAAGEILCLLGTSGSGKSTTLRMIAGIERADRGEIAIAGVTADSSKTFIPPEKRLVGLVFQDLALFPHLTARGNAAFGLFREPRSGAQGRADALLALVGLTAHADAYPHQLSGGEQQRLAVARALAPRPKAMLLDEPFSDLDDRLRDGVRSDVLAILREQETATLLVTHDPDEALRSADRIVLLRNGRIAQAGTPVELLNAPADLETAAFFSPVARLGAVVAGGLAQTRLGPVPAPGRADGAPVTIALRPRDLEIGQGGAEAVVTDVATASDGTHVRLTLEGEDIGALSALIEGTASLKSGDRVSLRARPGRGFVFPSP